MDAADRGPSFGSKSIQQTPKGLHSRCVGGVGGGVGSVGDGDEEEESWAGWINLRHAVMPHLTRPTHSAPRLLLLVQGMVPLIDVTEEVGGLQVVPRSHSDDAKIGFKECHPEMEGIGESGEPLSCRTLIMHSVNPATSRTSPFLTPSPSHSTP